MLLKSRQDLFEDYCSYIKIQREFFNPLIEKYQSINYEKKSFKELKNILDDDKLDNTYIHLNEYNKFNDADNLKIYDINNYKEHNNISIYPDFNYCNKTLSTRFNSSTNTNEMVLIKNIKISENIIQNINEIKLFSNGIKILTIPKFIIIKDNGMLNFNFFKTLYDDLIIEIFIETNDIIIPDIINYDEYSSLNFDISNQNNYNIIKSYMTCKLEFDLNSNMYKIILNENPYKYIDEIYIFDPEHTITECKFYVDIECGLRKYYTEEIKIEWINNYTILSLKDINIFYLNMSPGFTDEDQRKYYLLFDNYINKGNNYIKYNQLLRQNHFVYGN